MKREIERDHTLDLDSRLSVRRRKHKRRRLLLFAVLGVFAVWGIGYGAWWLVARADLVTVHAVSVSGADRVSASDIITTLEQSARRESLLARMLGMQNMLSWRAGDRTADLASEPRIAEAIVEKEYGTRNIAITVREREPYGIWCTKKALGIVPGESDRFYQTACFWFERSGLLLAPAPEVSGNLIHAVFDYSERALASGGIALPKEQMPHVLTVFSTLEQLPFAVREVRFENEERRELTVLLHNGPALYFSTMFSAPYAAEFIQSLRAKKDFSNIEYVDFRVENRAYYK